MALDAPLHLPEFPNPPYTSPQNATERAEWFASSERQLHLVGVSAVRIARSAQLGPKQTRRAIRALTILAYTCPL